MNTREALAAKLEDAGMYEDEALDWIHNVIRNEVLRLRCRCGKMIVEASDGCTWHEARVDMANVMRKTEGSVEF